MIRSEIDSRTVILLAAITVLTVIAGIFVAKFSTLVAAAVIAGLIIAVVSFLSGELALYMLIISMLLGPQFGVGDVGGESVRGRGITLRLDDVLLVVIGFGWFLKTAIKKELGLFLRTPLNQPIAYYFLACLVSTLLGFMMGRVKGGAGFFFVLKYFEYFIIYFMAVNYLNQRRQVENFTKTMIIVCLLVCIIAIGQLPYGGRATAPFEGKQGEPNTLGGYLVLMLPVVLGLLLTGYGSIKFKISAWVVIFFISVTLAATLSRSSWLALGPMILTLIYFSRRKLVLIIAVIVFLITAPFVLPEPIKERVLYTFKQPAEVGQWKLGNVRIDTSTSARLESWKRALSTDFMKHPFLGFGVTGYRFLDAQYARVLVETGLIGFITFTIMLGAVFRNALRTYRGTQDPLYSGISLGFLAGFAALLTHSIGANTFIIVRIMEPFWFLTAMVVMIPRIEAGEFLNR
ncbi:MAG: O-antigen ligase family protein [Syntrophales bacterium]